MSRIVSYYKMSHNEYQEWEYYVRDMREEIKRQMAALKKEEDRLNKISVKQVKKTTCDKCKYYSSCNSDNICYYCGHRESK
jgi:hypothetical protein